MSQISLHFDRSGSPFGLYFERNGIRISLDEALNEGFVVRADDEPAVATLLQRFVQSRGEYSR